MQYFYGIRHMDARLWFVARLQLLCCVYVVSLVVDNAMKSPSWMGRLQYVWWKPWSVGRTAVPGLTVFHLRAAYLPCI